MSRHPLDPLSLGFGVLFLAMALAGLGAAAGVTGDAVAVTAIGGVLAAGLVGLAVTARRLATPEDGAGDADVAAGVPVTAPDPTTPWPTEPRPVGPDSTEAGAVGSEYGPTPPTVRSPADSLSTEPGLESGSASTELGLEP